jgi:hypothetical protein
MMDFNSTRQLDRPPRGQVTGRRLQEEERLRRDLVVELLYVLDIVPVFRVRVCVCVWATPTTNRVRMSVFGPTQQRRPSGEGMTLMRTFRWRQSAHPKRQFDCPPLRKPTQKHKFQTFFPFEANCEATEAMIVCMRGGQTHWQSQRVETKQKGS